MSSSPMRKRRQSVRTPQRRPQTSSAQAEASYDPFLSSAPSGEAGILKQTLLAQLNARVSADTTTTFMFGQSSRSRDGSQPTKRYDGKHEKIFKTMKSIASESSEATMSRTTSRQNVSIAEPAAPTSVKRTTSGEDLVATPSKRRKMEITSSSKAATPQLSFNFGTSSRTTSNSELKPRDQVEHLTSRIAMLKSPSRSNLVHSNSSRNLAQVPASSSSVVKPQVSARVVPESSLPVPAEKPSKHQQDAEQARQLKRHEQRKRGTMQRMLAKTSLARPGWK